MPRSDDYGPEPACPRYPSLDLWRGIACLLVVAYHSSFPQPAPAPGAGNWAWVSYGVGELAHRMWVGVPMFFVISGYCIAATADSSRRKGHGLRTFAARRFRRIYPPYWICLGLTVVLTTAIDILIPLCLSGPAIIFRPWQYAPSQWFGNLTLTESWRYHLFGSRCMAYLGQSWSLVYEEQFYLVMGLLLVFARRRLFVAAAGVTAACLVVATACRHYQIPISGFFFDGGWTLFACGVLVYLALNYASKRGRLAAAGLLVAGLVYALRDPADAFTAHPAPEGTQFPTTFRNYDLSMFVATGFALVILASRSWDGWLSSRRCLRPVFACGTMCYSLYLVHATVLLFLNLGVRQLLRNTPDQLSPLVTIPVGITASVLASWVFYLTVEQRFLNPPQRMNDSPPGDATTRAPALAAPVPVSAPVRSSFETSAQPAITP